MKVFLAGETPMSKLVNMRANGMDIDPEQLPKTIKRRLFSFAYHGAKGGVLDREIRESIKWGHELMLDSGAFSELTTGKKIHLNDYAKFIRDHGHNYSVRANLDDLNDDGPKSWANMKELEAQGCQVFPVYHFADKIEYLVKILDEGYEFMALGGLVGASAQKLIPWLDHVWGKYLIKEDGTPRLRVHGFGLTAFDLMFRYPWAAVDSSSWMNTGNFGSCLFIVNGRFIKIDFSTESPTIRNANSWHVSAMPDIMKKKVEELIEPFNLTLKKLGEHYMYRHIINAHTFASVEDIHNTKTFALQQPTLF